MQGAATLREVLVHCLIVFHVISGLDCVNADDAIIAVRGKNRALEQRAKNRLVRTLAGGIMARVPKGAPPKALTLLFNIVGWARPHRAHANAPPKPDLTRSY
jgi:hypothetical protein